MTRTILCLAIGLASIACDGTTPDPMDGATSIDGGGVPPPGVDDPNASCDASAYGVCTDYEGDAAMFELGCSASGTWSESVFCDPAGACGSCTVDVGDYRATTYYFDGSGPESDSATICANGSGGWVDVPEVTCN